MMTAMFETKRRHLRGGVAGGLLIASLAATAQTVPTDLLDLSIEELLMPMW